MISIGKVTKHVHDFLCILYLEHDCKMCYNGDMIGEVYANKLHSTEKRDNMSDKSEYKNKYAAKNYDSLRIIVPKGCKELIKSAATKRAKGSINGYVNQAINERLQKDGFPMMQRQDTIEPDRTEQTAEPIQEQERNKHAGNQFILWDSGNHVLCRP